MADTAFIAYAHEPKSRRAATELAARLRRDGVLVWMDQWELKPGQMWQPAMESPLQDENAYRQLLWALGKSKPEPDDLDTLTFW